MSVHTDYDAKRDQLRESLNECLDKARELVVGYDIWGYDQMSDDYALNVFLAIKTARDMI